MMAANKELNFSLGFIGHKAEKLQNLFSEYYTDGDYFLKFTNYSELNINEGVMVWTNCFESKKHFNKILKTKLLFNL